MPSLHLLTFFDPIINLAAIGFMKNLAVNALTSLFIALLSIELKQTNLAELLTVLCQKALSAIFCHFHFFTDYYITSNYASAVKFL